MMTYIWLIMLVARLLLLPGSLLVAQAGVNPSGRWEGTVQVPDMEMKIEIDLTKNSAGILSGTFGQPQQGVKGLPLASVEITGRSIRFIFRSGAEPASTFEGALSDDGGSIRGQVHRESYSFPFSLTRTGEARIVSLPKNPPIAKELVGTWNGTLDVNGQPMRLIVTLANGADGTSSGSVMSPDGTGVAIALGVTEQDGRVSIQVPSVGASFNGMLNAARTEITGSWQQQGLSLPLTLRK